MAGRRRQGGRSRPSRGATRQARAEVPAGLRRWPDAWSIVLASGRATPTLVGHPWLFGGAIGHALPPTSVPPHTTPAIGLPCGVFDVSGRYIGHGIYNADSQIAVRMIARAASDVAPVRLPHVGQWLPEALRQAAAVRAAAGLSSDPERTAWRLANGDGDGLPGLVIDRMADGAVVLFSTAGARLWLDEVVTALQTEHSCKWVVARVTGDCHPSEGLTRGEVMDVGEVPEQVVVKHHGVEMLADPRSGQKSGLYLDQWGNHLTVAALAKGRYVIDAFCNGGGFGLHAARAGARKVLCVDASQRAVDLATEHVERGGFEQIEVLRADAVHVLRDIADGILGPDEGKPDMIVLDPPKFAARAGVVEDALAKYAHLNSVAMEALADGGLLVSCSCSGRVDERQFLRAIARAAGRAGRHVQLMALHGPGADHATAPAHAEGRYLKVAICRVRQPAGGLAESAAAPAPAVAWSPLED